MTRPNTPPRRTVPKRPVPSTLRQQLSNDARTLRCLRGRATRAPIEEFGNTVKHLGGGHCI